MKPQIAVIGDARVHESDLKYSLAVALGKALIDNGFRIINGGMTGVMEACCKGAKQSELYHDGMVICITPSFDPHHSNSYADIVIPTGLDAYRNAIVANSDAVVAIGGQAGTLSEMAFAWTFKRMLIAYDVSGWSGKLAGTRIDDRKRIDWENDHVLKVNNEKQVIEYLSNYLHYYTNRHQGLISIMKNEKLL